MSTFLYRKDSKTGWWKCVQGEAEGCRPYLVTHTHPIHALLTHAAHAQRGENDSCCLVFFNEEEKAGAQLKVLSPDIRPVVRVGLSVREMEKDLILSTLGELRGNRTKAANILGISGRTLRNKLKE